MSRSALIVVALAVVGVVGYGVVDRRHTNADVERLRAKILELERQTGTPAPPQTIVERRTIIMDRPATHEPPAAPGTEQAGSGEETPEQIEKRLANHEFRTPKEMEAVWEREFAAEPIDEVWANQAEVQTEIMRALPNDSSVLALECRASFCRLEVEHMDQRQSNDFIGRLFDMEQHGPLGDTTGGCRVTPGTLSSSGKMRYLVFIAKRGVPLAPDPE